MTDATQTPVREAVRWTIVLAVVLTAVLEVLDSTIVNVALPQIQAAFGITNDQTVWILTSYIVASVVVMPLTGFSPSPDFVKVAESTRSYAERVERGADLPAALERARHAIQQDRRQALLDVQVAAD